MQPGSHYVKLMFPGLTLYGTSTPVCAVHNTASSEIRLQICSPKPCVAPMCANAYVQGFALYKLDIFTRARCSNCGRNDLVAFSCKGCGVRPSCNTRRMVKTAAHLMDQVLPCLLVRQWVLSVPKRLCYFIQRDGTVLNMMLRIFLQGIVQSLSASCLGVASADKAALHTDALAFIHRFGLRAWYTHLPDLWVSTTSFAATAIKRLLKVYLQQQHHHSQSHYLWCASVLINVTRPMPIASQAICAAVSRAVTRFCSCGIKSASAT